MKSKSTQKSKNHALFIEWGGLTAGAYGWPAIVALALIVLSLIAFKFS